MILVTGSVRAQAETIDDVVSLALEHVERSRAEAGCLLHSVHRDVEDPLRLVFLEHWADKEALAAHFAVPASGEFVTNVAALAAGSPTLEMYDATPTRLRRLAVAPQVPRGQQLGDLDGVERGALAQVVARHEQHQTVVDRAVLPDAADVGRIPAGGVEGRGDVVQLDTRRGRRAARAPARP